ncbi:carboxymuconolactone decarboxylase family protein [Candidatus Woesearchaeota archaeon]|nr:carboxymuconolactone decarboxylase family protein [Candidatus Woesearchaeota archaeon]
MSFNEKRDFIKSSMQQLKEKNPEQVGAFHHFMQAIEQDGALSHKTKVLMAVSLAVKSQCSYCIAVHVKDAIDAGASDDEIMESAWLATLMGGGPSLMYQMEVKQALEEFRSQ